MMCASNSKSLRNCISTDQEVVLTHISEIYKFAKEAVTSFGNFECPLSDALAGTCIQSLVFNIRRQYRSKTKCTYSLYVCFRRDDGETVGVDVTLLMGTMDYLLSSVNDVRIAERYLSCINNEIEYYYNNLRAR